MAANRRKKSVLNHTTDLLAERWGAGLRTFAGHRPEIEEPPVVPTSFRQLDRALGIGGLPMGRITELVGLDSQGTTCLAARIAAKAQRKQQVVTIIDLSRTFNSDQAARCGLVAPEMLLVYPSNAFQILSVLEQAARFEGLVVVVLGRAKETLGHAGPSLLTSFLRRLHTITSRSHCAFLFITVPEERDPFTPTSYPPGFPLYEVADVRIWVQDDGWSRGRGTRRSYRSNLTVIKNRLALAGKGADVRVSLAGNN